MLCYKSVNAPTKQPTRRSTGQCQKRPAAARASVCKVTAPQSQDFLFHTLARQLQTQVQESGEVPSCLPFGQAPVRQGTLRA